jgi:hypothetical protein
MRHRGEGARNPIMNQMLTGVDWMSTIKPDDDDYVMAHIDWLKTASPDDWHRVALDFNWSNRLEPLLWIVMQDECDLATALDVFWRCEPGWDLMLMARGERADHRDEIDIITCIAQRLHAGTYTRRRIAFDAEPGRIADYEAMEQDCAKIADPPFRPHPDMIRSLRGHEVTNDRAFYARYPEVFHGTVWVEMPDWDGTTPDRVEARDEMRNIFFNLFGIGVLLAAIGAYLNDVGQYWKMMAGCAAMIAFWCWWINQATATVRAYLRREFLPVPHRQMMVVYGALVVFGIAWMQSYFALSDMAAAAEDTSLEARAARLGVFVGLIGPVWFGLRWAAQHYTYRRLFRR